MNKLISTAAAAFLGAMLVSFAPAANAATYNWDFTSASSVSASGLLTVNGNDDVTALSGTVGGQAITFYSNPNFPATATLHGVPNTGGADFIYDDYFNPATNAVTVQGILISVGAGSNQLFYDLSVDNGAPSANADLFSITKTGNYVLNEGVITSTQVLPTPLPSSWTMLIAGLALLSFFAYRNARNRPVAAARKSNRNA